VPRVIITDQLKSYGAAKREILPGVEHRQHRYLNHRAENSHQPVSGSGVCRDLNPRDTPSAFLPPMVPSPTTSNRGASGSHGIGSCSIGVNQGAAVYLQAWSWHGSTLI
jgi:hypothetical protein